MNLRSRWIIIFRIEISLRTKWPASTKGGDPRLAMRLLPLVSLMTSILFLKFSLADEPGFVSLFDGKSLKGWIPIGKVGEGYVAKNDLLICPTSGGGNLYTVREYSDFIFWFEFRLEEGSNNGIGIRVPLVDGSAAAYKGMEIQILDNNSPRYKNKIRPTQYHGSIYDVVPARRGFLKSVGEWNDQEITARGRQIKVRLNGVVIVDFDLDSITDKKVLEKHPGLARKSGRIGFLGHGTRVEFRKIRIKEIS